MQNLHPISNLLGSLFTIPNEFYLPGRNYGDTRSA